MRATCSAINCPFQTIDLIRMDPFWTSLRIHADTLNLVPRALFPPKAREKRPGDEVERHTAGRETGQDESWTVRQTKRPFSSHPRENLKAVLRDFVKPLLKPIEDEVPHPFFLKPIILGTLRSTTATSTKTSPQNITLFCHNSFAVILCRSFLKNWVKYRKN